MQHTLTENVTIGTSPSGVVWTAYRGRHTTRDVEVMRARLEALKARAARVTVRVDLTSTQAQFLAQESYHGPLQLSWGRTSVEGAPEQVHGLLDYLDGAELDLAATGVESAGTPAQIEARIRFCLRARRKMIQRIRAAIYRALG